MLAHPQGTIGGLLYMTRPQGPHALARECLAGQTLRGHMIDPFKVIYYDQVSRFSIPHCMHNGNIELGVVIMSVFGMCPK